MNDKLQKALSNMENMMAIQRSFAEDSGENYHIGLFNGLAIGHSCLTGEEPDFIISANRRLPKTHRKTNIRHKGKK